MLLQVYFSTSDEFIVEISELGSDMSFWLVDDWCSCDDVHTTQHSPPMTCAGCDLADETYVICDGEPEKSLGEAPWASGRGWGERRPPKMLEQ